MSCLPRTGSTRRSQAAATVQPLAQKIERGLRDELFKGLSIGREKKMPNDSLAAAGKSDVSSAHRLDRAAAAGPGNPGGGEGKIGT